MARNKFHDKKVEEALPTTGEGPEIGPFTAIARVISPEDSLRKSIDLRKHIASKLVNATNADHAEILGDMATVTKNQIKAYKSRSALELFSPSQATACEKIIKAYMMVHQAAIDEQRKYRTDKLDDQVLMRLAEELEIPLE